MSWLALHIYTEASQAEAWSEVLFNLGALSVSLEDAQAGTEAEKPIFGEPGEPVDILWQNSLLTALFDQHLDGDIIMQAAANQLNTACPSYQLAQIADTDWVRTTQAQFDPISISARLWVTPSWHLPPQHADAINLVLDPGLAFGTGSHPTTRLCLQWLDSQVLQGKSILDYGCGSGILATAAMKLGADKADGIDIDPQAIVASQQNAANNAILASFYLPDAAPPGQYDVIVANILTNPLKALAPMLANRCLPNGEIILSGILSEQADDIIAIYSEWFVINISQVAEGWVLMYGRRHA